MMASLAPRKKAVFIINSLTGGGAERVMTTLLRASERWRSRYDMSLVLLDEEPSAYDVPDWVATTQLDCRGKSIVSALALRKHLSALRPDVTLSFLTRANIANIVATAGLPTTCLVSERVNSSAHFSSGMSARANKALVRLAYRRADRIIAVSRGVAQDLFENFAVPASRLSVIANPVDHEGIAAMAAQMPALAIAGDYIVAAGRLVPNKNFAMLIDAFAQAGLPGSLIILGEGPLRPELAAQIARLGLTGRVHLPGFVDNPFAILKRATLFALPSNAEGFPNGLVEAMACGIPVVAANCASGPAEILLGRTRETVRGLTPCDAGAVSPTNDAASFARALRLVHDPAKRAGHGEAALQASGQFGTDRTAARYWAVIEHAIASARPDPAPDAAAATRSQPSGAVT